MRKNLPFGLCLSFRQMGNVHVCLCQSLVIKPILREQNAWIQWCCIITVFNPCFPHGVLTAKQCVHLKAVLLLKPCNNADKMVTSRGQRQGTGDLVGSSCVARLFHGFDALSLVHCFAYQNYLFYFCLPAEGPQKKIFMKQYKKCEEGLAVISLIQ